VAADCFYGAQCGGVLICFLEREKRDCAGDEALHFFIETKNVCIAK
jgi:hypothetical protein